MKKLHLLGLLSLSAIAGRVVELDSLIDNRTKATLATSVEVAYLTGLTASIQTQLNSVSPVFPIMVPQNTSNFAIQSDSDTGEKYPSDGLHDFYNNNVKTVEMQPGQTKFNVPIIASGGLTLNAVGSNLFYAGPDNASPAAPAFRAIVQGDVPSSAIPYPLRVPMGSGLWARDNGDGDSGYDMPSDGVLDTYANGVLTQETVAGLNTFIGGVTVTGDLNVGGNIGFPVQNANKVFAGPASGSDAVPSFRALVADDIPAIDISTSTHVTGVLAIGNGGTGANNMGPNGSIPFHNTDDTLATDFDAMNWNIAGRYLQLRNYYMNGDHTDEGNVQIGTINGTLTSTTAAINSNVGTIQRNLNGLFNVVQGPAYSDNLNGVTASTVLGRGVYLNVNSASQIGLMKTDENAINISADSQIDTLEVRTTTPTLNGSLGNVTLEKIQPNIGSSLSISGSLIGKDISLGGVTAPAIAGLRIQAGGDNNHATNSFTRVQSLNASGESFSFNTQSTPFASAPGGGVDTLNSFNTLLQLPPGSAPMAYGDVIGLGQSMILAATTSIPPSSAGIGISSVAYADIFSVAAGVTVPEFNGALAAVVNLNLGADGGNLGQFNGWKFRGIFQAGGTSTFNKGVGLYIPNGACAGFSSCYPVKSDDPDAHIVTAGLINGASPTELGYLSGLTGNVQTQLNAKASTSALTGVSSALQAQIGVLQGATTSLQAQVTALQGVTGGFVAKTGDSMSGALNLGSTLAVTGSSVLSNVAIGGSASSSVGMWLKSTQSLTGATNWGFSAGPTFNATTAGNSFESFPNIAAGVTTAVISHFIADGLGKGAGAIATRNAVVLGTGAALTGGVNNAFLSDNTSWTGNYFINQSGTTQSSLGGPVTVSNTLTASTVNVTGLTASSMVATDGAKNLVSKGMPETYLPFASGSLTSIVANEIVGYGKTERAVTIENLAAAASTFTCPITSPVLTLFDCGTSAGACTAGTTTLGSVTVTGAAGVAGVIASANLAAGHYWAWEITGGSCTSLNVTGTAQAGM